MSNVNNRRELFISALKDGVIPATGCTEPVAIAFAAATCMQYLDDCEFESIDVKVSPNIMKNAMAVIVPGTGRPGLKIATAAGLLVGDARKGLDVISDFEKSKLSEITKLADSGIIVTSVANVDDELYIEVDVKTKNSSVDVFIAGSHINVFKIIKNGEVILNKSKPKYGEISIIKQELRKVNFKDIWNFAITEPIENILFMKKAADLNIALSVEGLKNDYGLKLGKSIDEAKQIHFGSGSEIDLCNKMIAHTAAASDARMGGAQLPAMSNSGSGNQGISATVPICVVAKCNNNSEEELIRALTISHLTALYIHSFLPVLSAFCAATTAAMGSGAGIVYLLKGDVDTASRAINNMIGDISGMICDGAGCSCAMKVATSTSSMYRCVNLALQGIVIPSSNGIVFDKVEDSIKAIGDLSTDGLKEADSVILKTMLKK